MEPQTIWTVGHSNKPIEEFLGILAREWTAPEILSEKEARPRRLPDFARLEGTRVIYDGGGLPLEGMNTDPSRSLS